MFGGVSAAMQAIKELDTGRLAPGAAMKVINAISQAPPAPTWLFTLAAAAYQRASLRTPPKPARPRRRRQMLDAKDYC